MVAMLQISGPSSTKNALVKLTIVFVLWKLLLFVVAIASPGDGYDTSTTLLSPTKPGLVGKFVRWDAIYFTRIAQRNYVFEQEWAFGWGYTRLLRIAAKCIATSGASDESQFPGVEAWVGVVISHVAHLFSAFILHYLASVLLKNHPSRNRIAFIGSCLHILSPAGLFLSAPYGEPLFACFNFLAYYLFARALLWQAESKFWRHDTAILFSGFFVAVATTVRSNGLMSGLLFACEALHDGVAIIKSGLGYEKARKLAVTLISGILVSSGSILPQYLAYQQFCLEDVPDAVLRPWCDRMPPSIYNFVQSYYWNTGFLRYWTLSNLPLFLLAIPSILLFLKSSMWTLSVQQSIIRTKETRDAYSIPTVRSLRAFAITQALLCLVIVFNYHVQILTRLSSGYPLWYLWLAYTVVEDSKDYNETAKPKLAKATFRWMIIYSIIQGGLFASFLPPA